MNPTMPALLLHQRATPRSSTSPGRAQIKITGLLTLLAHEVRDNPDCHPATTLHRACSRLKEAK